ncbi:MAG TPA: hypothetical protein VGQ86_02905 [Candidatus Limnocylindria bacterium]|nr:hypothetical protein [Candidatus Limnocylindria bacterium]
MSRGAISFVLFVALTISVGATQASPNAAAAELTTTVYLPNITKMLGGADGWQTPFIVQNVGSVPTDLSIEFYAFADGSLVKTRSVTGLAPGTSIFHDPNSDNGLAPGGQFSVVIRSFGAPVVSVVNEHQNVTNQARQEALSYLGLSSGSTRVNLPYVAKSVGGWLTTFVMQNLGAATATVTAAFKSFDGTKTATLSRIIGPGRSQFVDPTIEPLLIAGTEYSVSLSSDQPIGVVVNAHNDAAGVPQPKGFSYNGIPASSEATTFLPYVQRNSQGATTRVIVQNIGTASATPTLRFRLLALVTQPALITGPTLAAGASWAYDVGTSGQLFDGEYSMTVVGGQFGVLGATIGAASASGATGTGTRSTTLFLPNITRTLGGATGWTTPINVQSTAGESATLRWYRFSDGALVHTQTLIFVDFGQTIRVDPRAIAQLTDNTQYAVVLQAESGGVAAVVTEVNTQGGDGTMNYEAVPLPPPAGFGTSYCSPASAPSGSTFQCAFFGLTPGSSVSIMLTNPTGQPTSSNPTNTVGADGVFYFRVYATIAGLRTITATAGTASKSAQFTVTPQSFPITITQSKYGVVTATTSPFLACWLEVLLPNGQLSTDPALVTKQADASGNVGWTYAATPGQSGTGRHYVGCTSGSETPQAIANFTAP